MKKIIATILLLFNFLLISCSEGDQNMSNEKFSMKATVLNIGERIEVDVYEAEYAEGIYWIIYDDNTVIEDTKGNKISVSQLEADDKVQVYYNGQVMMSYPPQVYAVRVKKL